MYFIDSWDNEKFLVGADRYNNHISTKDNSRAKNICNGQFKSDEVRSMSIDFAHTADELTVSLQDFLDEDPDNESWGFRDFRVLLHTCGGNDNDGCRVVSKELMGKRLTSDSATGWFLANNDGLKASEEQFNVISQCANEDLLGGYKKISVLKLFKTFTGLPAHNTLILSFRLFIIDSWDEPMYIQVDGQYVVEIKKQWGLIRENICGGVWEDEIVNFELRVPHTADTATVFIDSRLDQSPDDESYGIS